MRKGHTECFRHVINRSWKILALDRERFRCKVKDATSNSSKAFFPSPLIKPYTRLTHTKKQINNVQNRLTRRAWFPCWPRRSWYSISAISTWKSELIVIALIFSGMLAPKNNAVLILVFDLTALMYSGMFFFERRLSGKTSQLRLQQTFTFLPWITYFLKKTMATMYSKS